MCLAGKAPNPILIVLWAHLPSCEGDFDSEDENIEMLFKAKQLLQQESSERGVPQAVLPSLSQAHTKANNECCVVLSFIGCRRPGLMVPHDPLALRIEFVLVFFPMFGQQKIIEVFRYHSLKLSKCFLCVCCATDKKTWDCPFQPRLWCRKYLVLCEGRALLACLERRVNSTVRCKSGSGDI